MLTRDFQLASLLVELTKHAGVVNCHCRLARKCLEQVDRTLLEGTRTFAADNEGAEDLLPTQQRHHQHRTPPCPAQQIDVGISGFPREIRSLARHAARSGSAHERLVDVKARLT